MIYVTRKVVRQSSIATKMKLSANVMALARQNAGTVIWCFSDGSEHRIVDTSTFEPVNPCVGAGKRGTNGPTRSVQISPTRSDQISPTQYQRARRGATRTAEFMTHPLISRRGKNDQKILRNSTKYTMKFGWTTDVRCGTVHKLVNVVEIEK